MRRAMGLVVVAALALVGCGGGSEEAEDIPAPGQSATTAGGAHNHGAHGGGPANTSCSPSGTTVSIVAQSVRFNTDCLAAPADQGFTLNFENKDSVAHNIVFLESHTATSALFRADIFQGPATKSFNVGPMKAGTYAYHCEVHPNQMSGTLVVR